MTSCYPALRGKFGRTEYFLTTMPVGDLTSSVKFPVEMPEWKEYTIEERYQRNLNMKRIREEMAPYFAQDDNRFTGSLVLAVQNDERMEFEHLSKLTGDLNSLPGLYKGAACELGFVLMSGQEVLVPLDGQHRAKAFKTAIEGYARNDREPPTILPNTDLARDTVAVILVRFDKKLSRYIFNKINRYAKPTVKGDKLITDDDDAVAVITRGLIRDGVIPTRLVKISGNTLTLNASEFTTLSTFYEANKKLVAALPIPLATKPEKMEPDERARRFNELQVEWGRLLSGVEEWKKAIKVPGEAGDPTRIKLRGASLLGRPVGQAALINGYALACMKDRARADKDELVAKINKIDWGIGAELWRGLLVSPNRKILASASAANNAGLMTAHMIGSALTRKEAERVIKFAYGNAATNRQLPKPVALSRDELSEHRLHARTGP